MARHGAHGGGVGKDTRGGEGQADKERQRKERVHDGAGDDEATSLVVSAARDVTSQEPRTSARSGAAAP